MTLLPPLTADGSSSGRGVGHPKEGHVGEDLCGSVYGSCISLWSYLKVRTTMRDLPDMVEMDLHGVEKWAMLKT